jgi:hypothetical protein
LKPLLPTLAAIICCTFFSLADNLPAEVDTGIYSNTIDTNYHVPTSIRRSLKSAFDDSLVRYQISGAYYPNPYYPNQDGNGMHFGKCMGLWLANMTDSTIIINIDCGTQLIPLDSSLQTMIVTKSLAFEVPPHLQMSRIFDAMCGQIHDGPPRLDSPYSVGELADSNVIKIASYLNLHDIQNVAGQHAMWAYTDKIGIEDIKPYGMDSLSLKNTIEILNSVHVYTNLNPEPTSQTALPNEENDTYIVKKWYVYTAGGVFALLLIVIFVVSTRKKTS